MPNYPKLICSFVLSCAAFGAPAQNPLPLSSPDLDLWAAGYVHDMAPTPDGGMIVVGEFKLVRGVNRIGLAKLNADGMVDNGWNPILGGPVARFASTVAVAADGTTFIGGFFDSVDGSARHGLVKLDAAGKVDLTWNPGVIGGYINTLALAGNQLVAVGNFTSIGGQTRAGLAKLSTTGSGLADAQWLPSLSSNPTEMVFDGSSFLYVNTGPPSGGALRRVAIGGTGAIDATWQPAVNGPVLALALNGTQNLFVGGRYTLVQGTPRANLVKLSLASGAAIDATWNPSPDGSVSTLQLHAGALYAGGAFRNVAGQPRTGLVKLVPTGAGATDPTWVPKPTGGFVNEIDVDAAGHIHVGGDFTQIDSSARSALATFESGSSALRAASDFESEGAVADVAPLPDGGLVVAGRFSRVGALTRQNLLRLNSQGLVDGTWRADAVGVPVLGHYDPSEPPYYWRNAIHDLDVDAAGRIYVAGGFGSIGGTTRANIARLSSAGTADAGWAPNADGMVFALALDSFDNIYLAGNFTAVAGQTRANIARVSTSAGASVDPVWTASLGFGSEATSLALDGIGALFVGGAFNTINGDACCSGLAKLSTNGSGARDVAWSTRLTGTFQRVTRLLLDGNDLYVAGPFQGIEQGGVFQNRHGLARVAAAGGGVVDPLWNPDVGPFGTTAIALGGDGRMFATPFLFNNGTSSVKAVSLSGSGATDPSWQVSLDRSGDMLRRIGNTLYVGGYFTAVSGDARRGLAALAIDDLFGDGFESAP